ncbi:dTDP-4-dehydrorhamnose 3,5-epimerase [Candidatus Pelagibacter sp.]|jgi:dTDP-4-dehydrorhamnose 3,5-epimerase|nr:dTDP-4-dehydrorhamnose 3,5-epimerase [Candidatus Pelagibacter sp.]
MKLFKTKFKDLKIIKSPIFSDNRGYFKELVIEKNIDERFPFKVMSFSKKNVLRGMHLQLKYPQGKYISVIKGSILDVVIDLRKKSKTFLKIFSIILSEKNAKSIFIPEGFAHGFYTLSKENYIVYSCTKYRSKNHEITIKWDDPKIKNIWPIKKPILSSKDKRGIFLKEFLNKI